MHRMFDFQTLSFLEKRWFKNTTDMKMEVTVTAAESQPFECVTRAERMVWMQNVLNSIH